MLTARLVQIPDTIKATESFSLMVEIIDEATGEVVEDLKWKVNSVCLSVCKAGILLFCNAGCQLKTFLTFF